MFRHSTVALQSRFSTSTTRQKAPASGVPIGLPSYKTSSDTWTAAKPLSAQLCVSRSLSEILAVAHPWSKGP